MTKKEKGSAMIAIIVLVVIILIGIGAYFLFFNKSTSMTAEEVVNKIKEKNSNVGEIVVYNEETDPNDKLGRPNQYTSKATFADNRLDQPQKITMEELNNNEEYSEYQTEEEKENLIKSNNDPVGGTVEVFETKEDAEARKNYIEALSSISSQYCYLIDKTLFRVEGDLTPTQAQEYETAFNEIMK